MLGIEPLFVLIGMKIVLWNLKYEKTSDLNQFIL